MPPPLRIIIIGFSAAMEIVPGSNFAPTSAAAVIFGSNLEGLINWWWSNQFLRRRRSNQFSTTAVVAALHDLSLGSLRALMAAMNSAGALS